MRILLISPNTEMLPDPVFPLGLAFLSGALEHSSHQHEILDLCFTEDYGEDHKFRSRMEEIRRVIIEKPNEDLTPN